MIRAILTPLLFLFLMACCGCGSGYKKENGRWAWVGYNAADGRYVVELDAHDQSFEVLNDPRYARDQSRVFYEATPVIGAEPKSFEILPDKVGEFGRIYARDAHHVYLMGDTVVLADPHSFRVIKAPFAHDAEHMFNGTVPIEGADAKTFQILRDNTRWTGYSSQEHFFLYYGEQFQNFTVTPEQPSRHSGGVWWRDAHNAYYDIMRIEGVDLDSFQVLDEYHARDKNHQYKLGFHLEDFYRRHEEFNARREALRQQMPTPPVEPSS